MYFLLFIVRKQRCCTILIHDLKELLFTVLCCQCFVVTFAVGFAVSLSHSTTHGAAAGRTRRRIPVCRHRLRAQRQFVLFHTTPGLNKDYRAPRVDQCCVKTHCYDIKAKKGDNEVEKKHFVSLMTPYLFCCRYIMKITFGELFLHLFNLTIPDKLTEKKMLKLLG